MQSAVLKKLPIVQVRTVLFVIPHRSIHNIPLEPGAALETIWSAGPPRRRRPFWPFPPQNPSSLKSLYLPYPSPVGTILPNVYGGV